MSQPVHVHDCSFCVFLGTIDGTNHDYQKCRTDLYFHPGKYPTVIARYGPYGEYSSGLVFVGSVLDDLTEAAKRAVDAGLLSKDHVVNGRTIGDILRSADDKEPKPDEVKNA